MCILEVENKFWSLFDHLFVIDYLLDGWFDSLTFGDCLMKIFRNCWFPRITEIDQNGNMRIIFNSLKLFFLSPKREKKHVKIKLWHWFVKQSVACLLGLITWNPNVGEHLSAANCTVSKLVPYSRISPSVQNVWCDNVGMTRDWPSLTVKTWLAQNVIVWTRGWCGPPDISSCGFASGLPSNPSSCIIPSQHRLNIRTTWSGPNMHKALCWCLHCKWPCQTEHLRK